jgi:putative ABC transport system permease protein
VCSSDLKNFFPQFAVDVPTWRAMYPEFTVPEDQWKAFAEDRQGCIVGRNILDRFGWKIGDKIPLQATIYRGLWDFTIRGVYDAKREADDKTQFWFHFNYLNERTPFQKDYVGWYVIRVKNPDNAPQLIKAVDSRFENSPFETMTQTEKEFMTGFVKQFGNIKLIILIVGSVVMFTLLLITGSNMSLSIRERTNEIAILKAMGFSSILVFILILAESVGYAVTGGAIGLFLCKLMTLGGDPTKGLLPVFYLDNRIVLAGAGIAVTVGLVSGIVPAFLAMRLNIVEALRRI